MAEWPIYVPEMKNIAIATDFSQWSDLAMEHALMIARWYGAKLHILHTIRPSEFSFVPNLMVQLDQVAERDCENLLGRLHAARKLDGIAHRLWNLYGEVTTFGDFVRNQRIDLLVVGTRGRSGISKLVFGSIAEQIFHCVSCAVLTVGPWARDTSRRLALNSLVFATDLSSASIAAMPYVMTAAKPWCARVEVLHVCTADRSDSQLAMEAYRSRLEEITTREPWLSIRYHQAHGEASPVVVNFASERKADLIVLGPADHHSLHQGPTLSDAYEIVRQARCPVLSVR